MNHLVESAKLSLFFIFRERFFCSSSSTLFGAVLTWAFCNQLLHNQDCLRQHKKKCERRNKNEVLMAKIFQEARKNGNKRETKWWKMLFWFHCALVRCNRCFLLWHYFAIPFKMLLRSCFFIFSSSSCFFDTECYSIKLLRKKHFRIFFSVHDDDDDDEEEEE